MDDAAVQSISYGQLKQGRSTLMDMVVSLTQRVFAAIYWLLAKFWYRLEVRGVNNLNGITGPVIIIANHKSRADHFFIGAAFPKFWRTNLLPIRFMVKDELFAHPLSRWFFSCLGSYPAQKGQGLDVSLAQPLALLNQNKVVGIYPEGRRIYSDDIGEFRRGVGELVSRAPGIMVLPVVVAGANRLIGQLIPKFRGKIVIRFGTPQKFDTEASPEQITEQLFSITNELYHSS
jgi:1-acyl-sn-glycerol-3-phosphate acyltransferase